jgi:hypothetical protein
MATEPDPSEIPAMLRGARGAYANTIAAMLAASGFDDLPRNGPFVLGGMANHGDSAVDMIRGLGVSRQAASQLIDVLVLRGYLDRQTNPDDRRRMDIELTERGLAAAAVAGLRAGLAALAAIKQETQGDRDPKDPELP